MSLRTALGLCREAGTAPLIALAALALAQAALPVLGLFAMKFLVDAVALGVAGEVAAAVAWRDALVATALAAGVALLGGLCRSVSTVVSENHGRRLGDAGVQRLQEHVAALDLIEFDRPGFHDALQRSGQEAGQRPVRLCQDLTALLVATVSLLLMTGLLFQVAPWLPLLVGAAAVPIAWVRRRHARLRYDWQRDHVVTQREVGYLGAVLTGRATAKDVRLLGLVRPFGRRLRQARELLRGSLRTLARRRARDELLVHSIASAALFGAYVVLARDALAGALTLGGLVLHAQAAQRTQNAVRDLLASWTGVHEHRLFLRPLVAFHQRRAAGDEPEPDSPTDAPAGFEVDGLTFAYPSMPRPAVAGLDLRVAPGERIAVIGPNGSGKSTLIKLLCGLYRPDAGVVRLDGAPPRALTGAGERQLAVLLQDAATFEATLRDNLSLGHVAQPADDLLWHALELVGLAERCRDLPLGLDTPWSRRLAGGVDWSTGEARRIALARTLLQPGRALLLDEPFASLDGSSAAAVAAHLAEQPRDRVLLVVDHRGPALSVVDRVLWLDHGRLRADVPIDRLRDQPGFGEQFPEWRD